MWSRRWSRPTSPWCTSSTWYLNGHPWVAHALSRCTHWRYGRIASISATRSFKSIYTLQQIKPNIMTLESHKDTTSGHSSWCDQGDNPGPPHPSARLPRDTYTLQQIKPNIMTLERHRDTTSGHSSWCDQGDDPDPPHPGARLQRDTSTGIHGWPMHYPDVHTGGMVG
jgi:hypothetical protein